IKLDKLSMTLNILLSTYTKTDIRCCTGPYRLRVFYALNIRAPVRHLFSNAEDVTVLKTKSNDRQNRVLGPSEQGVRANTHLGGRGTVVAKNANYELGDQTTLPEQEGPSEGTISQLEVYSTRELAYHITLHDWDIFTAIHEYEFLYQVFGRDHFGKVMCNLDVYLRRFNELQYWVVSEICLTTQLSKRSQLLRKFIKLAAYCKEQQNLNAFFAIVIGLSNVSVSRLTLTWERLPSRFRKMLSEFEMLIDPSRNHRLYRLYLAKLHPPVIPFTPLLMKEMSLDNPGSRMGLKMANQQHQWSRDRLQSISGPGTVERATSAVQNGTSASRMGVRKRETDNEQHKILDKRHPENTR
ncbi:unnamed protein product, partial [Meganyctiphanes norvegica]